MGVFGYFDCFSDYWGLVAADVGYDFCFVKVTAVSGNCRTGVSNSNRMRVKRIILKSVAGRTSFSAI
jgi:hypothetical protein